MLEIKFLDIPIIVCPKTYPPSEDTELLASVALKYLKPGMRVIEIGVGTGAIIILLAKRGAEAYGTDISEEAIKCTQENARRNNVNINLALGHYFGPFSDVLFDMILFNPPYLPADDYDFLLEPYEKLALVGGREGYETIIEFIKQLDNKLKSDGIALFVLSTLSRPSIVFETAKKRGYRVTVEASKKFFFEEIMVISLRREKRII